MRKRKLNYLTILLIIIIYSLLAMSIYFLFIDLRYTVLLLYLIYSLFLISLIILFSAQFFVLTFRKFILLEIALFMSILGFNYLMIGSMTNKILFSMETCFQLGTFSLIAYGVISQPTIKKEINRVFIKFVSMLLFSALSFLICGLYLFLFGLVSQGMITSNFQRFSALLFNSVLFFGIINLIFSIALVLSVYLDKKLWQQKLK